MDRVAESIPTPKAARHPLHALHPGVDRLRHSIRLLTDVAWGPVQPARVPEDPELNGRVSITHLRSSMPEMPRRTLNEIRFQCLLEHDPHSGRPIWRAAARIWSMGFTELDRPWSDESTYVVLERDPGSGMMRATHACRRATSCVAAWVRRWLTETHGAPLVIRSDKGSHFTPGKMLAGRHVCRYGLPRPLCGTPAWGWGPDS